MYIGLSYDGRITSTSASPSRRVSGNVYLDSYGNLVVEASGSAGRVTYYDSDYESCIEGKIRYIGDTLITYYDSDYESCIKGKVRYIGDTFISYYDSDYESCMEGKVRYVGNTFISYFDSDSSYPGRVRYVGDVYMG